MADCGWSISGSNAPNAEATAESSGTPESDASKNPKAAWVGLVNYLPR